MDDPLLRKFLQLEKKIDRLTKQIEAEALSRIVGAEMSHWGHRLVFHKKTGACLNVRDVPGVDPRLLDATGYICRTEPEGE